MFKSEKTRVVNIEGKLDACCVLPSPQPGATASAFNIVNESGDLQDPADSSSDDVDDFGSSRSRRNKSSTTSSKKTKKKRANDGSRSHFANLLRGSDASAVLSVLTVTTTAAPGSDATTTSLIVADDSGTISRRCLTTGESLASYKLEPSSTVASAGTARSPTVLLGSATGGGKEGATTDTVALYVVDKESQLVALDPATMLPKQVFASAGGHDGAAHCMAVSPANDVVVTGHDCQRLVVWDVADGVRQSAFTYNADGNAPDAAVTSAAVSPDGSLLAAGDATGAVTLYELAVQRELFDYDVARDTGSAEAIEDSADDAAQAVAVTHILFSSTRYWMACATAAGSIIVYDLEHRDIVVSTTHPKHSFVDDGGDGSKAVEVSIWKDTARRPQSGVRSMAFSTDGLSLFAVRHDGTSTRISIDSPPQ